MKFTFEQLPEAASLIYNKLDSIERLLSQKIKDPQIPEDELLTVTDTATFLTLSVPTIYGLISKGIIPYMKRSKRVYFSKIDLINYLKQGKRKTTLEIEAEADDFLSTQKRKGGRYVQ